MTSTTIKPSSINICPLTKAMSNSPRPDSVRYCANIKSKKHPDVRCPNRASQGDYCGLHCKKPTRFVPKTPVLTPYIPFNCEYIQQAICIQHMWKNYAPLLRFRNQGPAANDPSLSHIDRDIYTFDSVTQIPRVYVWSYADTHKNIWLFDIRSLWMMYEKDQTPNQFVNPYTREAIPPRILDAFRRRCMQLRAHKYVLAHISNFELSPDQLWQQRILDVILHMDNLGYHTCVHWFEELPMSRLITFYTIMYQIWMSPRLTPQTVKNLIIPDHASTQKHVFEHSEEYYRGHTEKRWWQKHVLNTMEALIKSGTSKDAQTQGAMLVIRAYAFVSKDVRNSYHWLVS